MKRTKELTEHQRELLKKNCCIYCGREVEPIYYGGKNNRGCYYPEECKDCAKESRDRSTGMYYGAGKASLTNEFARRLKIPKTGIK